MSEQRLLGDLSALGVRPGDLLMIHASLRKIGLASTEHGEGGAELLLDALEAAVGSNGTLLMLLGTDYPLDWVNQRPAGDRAALLAGTEPFDPKAAAAMPQVGWLAEAFRRRPDTIVTDNPSGRFGASGRLAQALLENAPWHDYYGPGSPLERLCDQRGRILRLGADPDTVTVLHYSEYLADLPEKRRTQWDFLVRTADGARHMATQCLDDSAGIVEWEVEDYFALILKAYLALGRHREGRVGNARSELIDAADIVRFGTGWMERHLRPRG